VNVKGLFNELARLIFTTIPQAGLGRYLLDHVANLLTEYPITLTLYRGHLSTAEKN